MARRRHRRQLAIGYPTPPGYDLPTPAEVREAARVVKHVWKGGKAAYGAAKKKIKAAYEKYVGKKDTGSKQPGKVKFQPKVDGGNAGTVCKDSIKITLHPEPKRGHPVGRFTYAQFHEKIVGSLAGRQSVDKLLFIGTTAQMRDSTGTGYGISQNHKALNIIFPSLKTTGGGLYDVHTPSCRKFFINHCQVNMDISNVASNNCYFTIYAVMFKKPQVEAQDAIEIWSQGYVQSNDTDGATPQPTMTFPAAGSGVSAGGYPQVGTPGAYPTDVKKFKSLCKVVGCVSKMLPPNAHCTLRWGFNMNSRVDNEVVEQQAAISLAYIPGRTVQFVIVCRGPAGVDITTAMTHHATYMATQLAIVSKVTYKLQQYKDAMITDPQLSYVADNVPADAVVANQLHYDVYTNAVEDTEVVS